jgi:hypothetical protein
MKKLFFRIAISAIPFTAVSCAFLPLPVYAARARLNEQEKTELRNLSHLCWREIDLMFIEITNINKLANAASNFCTQHNFSSAEKYVVVCMVINYDTRWVYCTTRAQMKKELFDSMHRTLQDSKLANRPGFNTAVKKLRNLKGEFAEMLTDPSVIDYKGRVTLVSRIAVDLSRKLDEILYGDVDRETVINMMQEVLDRISTVSELSAKPIVDALLWLLTILHRGRPAPARPVPAPLPDHEGNWFSSCSVQ